MSECEAPRRRTACRWRGCVRCPCRTVRHAPCFHGNHFGAHGQVLSNVDRAIHCVVPHRGIIRAIHYVYLDLHGSGQGREALVLSHSLQLVCLSLVGKESMETDKTTSLVVLRVEERRVRRPAAPYTNLAFTLVTTVPTVTFSLMWTGPYVDMSQMGGLLFLSTTSNSTSTSAEDGGSPLSEARTRSRYLSRYRYTGQRSAGRTKHNTTKHKTHKYSWLINGQKNQEPKNKLSIDPLSQ